MALNKIWMHLIDRSRVEYEIGMESFLDFAYMHSVDAGRILCPYIWCSNMSYLDRKQINFHHWGMGCGGITWYGTNIMKSLKVIVIKKVLIQLKYDMVRLVNDI